MGHGSLKVGASKYTKVPMEHNSHGRHGVSVIVTESVTDKLSVTSEVYISCEELLKQGFSKP